jgi:hypothetical protein
MCFSAPASFIAASGLSVAGICSLREARHKKMALVALIPFFFALQQLCEGLVWLGFDRPSSFLHQFGIYGFLFFASMWWPVWIPTSLLVAETDATRKKYLLIILFVGLLVAGTYLVSWFISPLEAIIIDHHIAYPLLTQPFKSSSALIISFEIAVSFLYLIATIGPLFLSSLRYMWAVGAIILLLCIYARVFYLPVFGSIWCFFAAIASILIVIIIYLQRPRLFGF